VFEENYVLTSHYMQFLCVITGQFINPVKLIAQDYQLASQNRKVYLGYYY